MEFIQYIGGMADIQTFLIKNECNLMLVFKTKSFFLKQLFLRIPQCFFQSIKANMEPIKRLLPGKISKWLLTAMGHSFLTLALCVLFLDGRL